MIEFPLILRGSRTMAQQWLSAKGHSWDTLPVSHSFGGIHVISLPNFDLPTEKIEPH